MKECPFCGSSNLFVFPEEEIQDQYKYHWVVCKNCESEGPFDRNRALAIEKWNKRSEPIIKEEI